MLYFIPRECFITGLIGPPPRSPRAAFSSARELCSVSVRSDSTGFASTRLDRQLFSAPLLLMRLPVQPKLRFSGAPFHGQQMPWVRCQTPLCTAAAHPATAAMNQAQQSLQQLGAATIAVSTAKNGAAFWQLVLAFVSGGLFVATVAAALLLAYTLGATNVAKAKAMLRVAFARTVRCPHATPLSRPTPWLAAAMSRSPSAT